MQRLEYAVGRRRGEGQLDVARERLGGADLRELCVEAATPAAEKLRRLADEQRVHVDHRPVLRQQRDDRHIDNHAVGEEPLHGGLRLGIAAGTHIEVGLDDQQPLVEPLEVNVLLARLQPGVHLAAGHGGRDKKPLRLKPGRQRAEHLLILLAHVDGEQAGLFVHARDDLLVPLEHCRVRREVRLRGWRLGGRWLGGRLAGGGDCANAVAVTRPSATTMSMLCFFMIKKRFRPEPVKNTPCDGQRGMCLMLGRFQVRISLSLSQTALGSRPLGQARVAFRTGG